MTAGLIINPRSGGKSAKGPRLAEMLHHRPGVHVGFLEEFGNLNAILHDFADRGVRDIFISSGDGTIQAIQTALAEQKIFDQLPRLGLLPHGTTNMTASDLGVVPKSLAAQADLISNEAKRTSAHTDERTTLRIANPRDGIVRHGMFTGSGALWQGAKFCQDSIHQTGMKGDLATFATLSTGIVRALVSKPKPDDPSRIDRPHQMHVTADGDVQVRGQQLSFLATTLNQLILGSRPFWGKQTAAIRSSVFPYPPPKGVGWMYKALYGPDDRLMPMGCTSFSANVIEIKINCPFVVDGEFYDPPEDQPLRIENGASFTYIRHS